MECTEYFLKNVLIWLHQVSVAARGIQFPNRGSNPGPLHWKHRILATRPPGKSPGQILNASLNLKGYLGHINIVLVIVFPLYIELNHKHGGKTEAYHEKNKQCANWSFCSLHTTFICRLPGILQFNSVQSLSSVWLFVTPWIAAHQASLSITNSRNLPKLASIELVMPSNHLILCCPLLLLPSFFPNIRVFSNESALCIRWPK